MNEKKIIAFMEQLPKGRSRRSCPDTEDAPMDAEMEELEMLWNQQLSTPLTDMKSQPECERFSERLQAYEQGLLDKPATVTGFPDRRNRWQLWVGAIAALLLVTLGIDQFNYHNSLKTQRMNGEIAQLKEMLALTLIRQNTATDRIDGVVMASDLNSPEPALIDELIRMLNADPSVNVRLAALKSLEPLSENPVIRKSLIQAIEQQSSSLVTLNICKVLMLRPHPEEYPMILQQLEGSGLGADYLEHFRKTLKPQI